MILQSPQNVHTCNIFAIPKAAAKVVISREMPFFG